MFPKGELVDDLVSFFMIPIEDATRIFEQSFVYYGAEWREKERDTKQSRIEFYKTSRFNSFDLAHWHENVDFVGGKSTYERNCFEMQTYVDGLNRPCRIIDISGGIASICIRLAQQGHEVHYYDLGKVTSAFAKHRCDRYGVDVTFHDDIDSIPGDHFDVAICYDTIEHLDDDDIEFVMTRIYHALVHDGRVFTSIQFPQSVEECEGKASHLPEHLGRSPTSIFPILERIGFKLTDSSTHYVKP
jgi:hypothetical protein